MTRLTDLPSNGSNAKLMSPACVRRQVYGEAHPYTQQFRDASVQAEKASRRARQVEKAFSQIRYGMGPGVAWAQRLATCAS